MSEKNIFGLRKVLQSVIAAGNALKEERSADSLEPRTSRLDKTHDLWPMDGLDGKFSYEVLFREIMQKEMRNKRFSFEAWLAQRKAAGKNCHLLDIFGGAYFLHDSLENIDSITGVRLKNVDNLVLESIKLREAIDHEEAEENESEFEKNLRKKMHTTKRSILTTLFASDKRKIIEGNYFDPQTFALIKERVRAENSEAYDLIILNPVGGLDSQLNKESNDTDLILFYLHQLNKIYTILSDDEGILLINFPPSIWKTLKDYLLAFPAVDNVEIEILEKNFDSNLMKLKKFPGAPQKLPIAEMFPKTLN